MNKINYYNILLWDCSLEFLNALHLRFCWYCSKQTKTKPKIVANRKSRYCLMKSGGRESQFDFQAGNKARQRKKIEKANKNDHRILKQAKSDLKSLKKAPKIESILKRVFANHIAMHYRHSGSFPPELVCAKELFFYFLGGHQWISNFSMFSVAFLWFNLNLKISSNSYQIIKSLLTKSPPLHFLISDIHAPSKPS